MKSIAQKLQQCEGLIGTKDVTDWESEFLGSVLERSNGGKDTTTLTTRQVDVIEGIYRRNFA
jgi:hypothetical protein